jgi:hypothetical protein
VAGETASGEVRWEDHVGRVVMSGGDSAVGKAFVAWCINIAGVFLRGHERITPLVFVFHGNISRFGCCARAGDDDVKSK